MCNQKRYLNEMECCLWGIWLDIFSQYGLYYLYSYLFYLYFWSHTEYFYFLKQFFFPASIL